MIAVFITLLCALFLFCACEKVEDMGTLPEFSKPYMGEYICKELSIGGEDFIEKFEYVKLELDYDGEFTLSYSEEEGQSGTYSGKYSVSPEGDEITMSSRVGLRSVSHTFPMENGKILVELNLQGKQLHAVFSTP